MDKGNKISLMMVAVAVLMVIAVVLPAATMVSAQQLTIEKPNIDPLTGVFVSEPDGFKVTVPEGWVVEDLNTVSMMSTENQLGYGILAIFCPKTEALPAIGGLWNCEEAEHPLFIYRDAALGVRPEFSQLGDPTKVTLDDYVAYQLVKMKEGFGGVGSYGNFKIVNTTDRTVNIGPDNATTVPAKLMEWTYVGSSLVRSDEIRAYTLLVLVQAENTNTGTIITEGTAAGAADQQDGRAKTGYRMTYEDLAAITPSGRLPNPQVQAIFDSFAFVR